MISANRSHWPGLPGDLLEIRDGMNDPFSAAAISAPNHFVIVALSVLPVVVFAIADYDAVEQCD
jgi:hypothetical protein